MKTDNRLYDRIYLPEEKLLHCEGLGFAFEGKVGVVGLGGMFVRTDKSYPVGTVLPLRLHADGEVVEADCIVRDITPEGFGVEFVKLRGANEDYLKHILDRFRAA